jgi:hypothetical protein
MAGKEFYDPDSTNKNKSISKWGGFLKDIEKFEPLFFNISPLEAERMDLNSVFFCKKPLRRLRTEDTRQKNCQGRKWGFL